MDVNLHSSEWPMTNEGRRGRILRGAKRIARYVFDDEEQARAVYGLGEELGLFWLGGMIAADTAVLDEKLREKKAQGNAA
jgi:hypothetical protein